MGLITDKLEQTVEVVKTNNFTNICYSCFFLQKNNFLKPKTPKTLKCTVPEYSAFS